MFLVRIFIWAHFRANARFMKVARVKNEDLMPVRKNLSKEICLFHHFEHMLSLVDNIEKSYNCFSFVEAKAYNRLSAASTKHFVKTVKSHGKADF